MRDNDSQKIIVVGIPKTMDDAGLSELFSGFGTVADAKVVLDVNNKQPRGFGFVTFTSGAAMRKAIQDMNKKVIEGRTLNVRQLVPKDKFQAEKSKDENAPDAASRPCWLLRKGKCTKGDLCPFSHETKNGEFGSCFEFMQTGECKRGDKCIFSHKVAGANTDGQQEENGAEAGEEATPVQTEKAKAETKKALVKSEVAGGGEQKQRVCYAFQKGKCHRGKKCLFLHEKVPEMANDVPVVVAKKDGAAPAAKRGEFEVVTQAEAGKKRGRANSHDDGKDDDDEEDDVEEERSAPKQQRTSAPAVRGSQKSDGPQRDLAAAHKSTSLSSANKGKPTTTTTTTTHASPAKAPRNAVSTRPVPAATKLSSAPSSTGDKRPRNEDTKKPFTDKRPRSEDAPKKSFTDKRPRFDSSGRPFEKSEHPAAKRIFERENGGPSKYAPQPGSSAPVRKEDKWKSRNNKNALQRLNKKNRPPGYQPPQPHQHVGERPAQPKREKVDMGAAFDSDDDRKPRGGGGAKPRVVDKAALKANREKLQQERRAKRDAKKTALGRLKTQEKVEL